MKIFPSLLLSSPLEGEESEGEGVLAIRFIFVVISNISLKSTGAIQK
jgi:hypothetical protein